MYQDIAAEITGKRNPITMDYSSALYDILTTADPDHRVYCSVTAGVLVLLLSLPLTVKLWDPKLPVPARAAWALFYSTAFSIAWRHGEWSWARYIGLLFHDDFHCDNLERTSFWWCMATITWQMLIWTIGGIVLLSFWMMAMIFLAFHILFLVFGPPEGLGNVQEEKKQATVVYGRRARPAGETFQMKPEWIAAIDQDLTGQYHSDEDEQVMAGAGAIEGEPENTMDENDDESGTTGEEETLTDAQVLAAERAERIKRFDNYVDHANLSHEQRKEESWKLLDSLLSELRSTEEMELDRWENEKWDGESVEEGEGDEDENAVGAE